MLKSDAPAGHINKSDAAPSFQEGVTGFFKKAHVSQSMSNASQHWNTERILSVVLAPSLVLGVFFDNVLLDLAIGTHLVSPHVFPVTRCAPVAFATAG